MNTVLTDSFEDISNPCFIRADPWLSRAFLGTQHCEVAGTLCRTKIIAARRWTSFSLVVLDRESAFLNRGLYTVPEAARLTRVSVGKIRRWLKGYDFKSGERVHHSDAVWQGELRPIENKLALSFRDLLELRFVDAFIGAGVSWRTMRRAHAKAQEQLQTTHPFCSNRIFTDGRSILLRQGEEDSDRALINLANDQVEFARIVEPFQKELEFSGADIVWWPLGKEREIVIDPRRNFGQPTVMKSGVPTAILARSAKANSSQEIVARWYEVHPNEVRDAVEFEESLAKAA